MRRAVRSLLPTLLVAASAVATAATADSTVIHTSQSRRILLHGAAANVLIGDPSVADVTLLDAHSIILVGKSYGATDVLVLDRNGRTLFDTHVMVTAPDSGVVTLHRGTGTVEYSCSPRCQALAPPKESGPASPSASPPSSGAPTNTPAAAPTPSM